ncbi:MAG: cell division control protein Cdc6, partial [Nitrososphaera sp.]
ESAARVDEKHVRAAEEKIEKNAPYDLLKDAPTHMKLVVLAIAKSKDSYTGDVYDTYALLCKHMEQEPLTQRRVTQMISRLDQLGMVATDVVSQGRYGRSQKIRIKIPLSTVKEALKEDFASLID